MYSLHHYIICPRSRNVRVVLTEKKVPFNLITQEFWKQDVEFRKMNPMLTVPFVTSDSSIKLVGVQSILEYFEETMDESIHLMPKSSEERAEIRRIITWVDDKMYHDATKLILHEKVYKFFQSGFDANQKVLTFARSQLPYHLQYFNWLLTKRHYLTGNDLTLADFALASHLSSLDYFGEVNWRGYSSVKDWYSVIKSRPSFRKILEDKVPGFRPASCYDKLDF